MANTDHFSHDSKGYKEYRPGYPESLFDYLTSLCPAHAQAWDVGCGTGQSAFQLSKYFDKVLATDLSESQINMAQKADNISYRVAKSECCPLPDRSVDLITIAQALHWFDFDAFYREVGRVLKPGGIIAAWSYGLIHFENNDIDRLIIDFYNDTIGNYWPPQREYIDQQYKTIPFPFKEITGVPKFEMKWDFDRTGFINYLGTWSAVKYFQDENGFSPLINLEKHLSSYWPDNSSTGYAWPIFLRIGKSN